jgi:hypothetical protein
MLRPFVVASTWFVAAVVAATAQESLQADADSMRAKVAVIVAAGESVRGQAASALRTAFTDREVNAYFRVHGPTFLPHGVVSPQVTFGDHAHVTARANVDLDAVRRARPRDWLDPLAYVTGSLEVTAAGVVTGANGMGTFEFESATVAGLAVPKSVLQELVRYYTTTPEMPSGIDLDKPFALPANIRSVSFERGRATVIQ